MLEIVQKNMRQLVGKTVIQCLYKEVSLDYSNRVSKNIFFCFVIKIGAMFPFFCRKVPDRNVYEVKNLGASYDNRRAYISTIIRTAIWDIKK